MSRLSVHAQKIRKYTLLKKHIASIAWELDLYALKKLSSSSYRIWHLIRAYAAFDTETYSTTLSQEFLAEQLDCSVKTITRAISEIKREGLIHVQNNVSKKTGMGANTYFIVFPEEAYAQTAEQADKTSPLPSIAIDIHAVKANKVIDSMCKNPIPRNCNSRSLTMDNIDSNPPVKNDVHNRDYNSREKNNKSVVVDIFEEQSNSGDYSEETTHLERKVKQLITMRHELQNKKQQLEGQLKPFRQTYSSEKRIQRLKQALCGVKKENDTSLSLNKKVSELFHKRDQLDFQQEQITRQIDCLQTEIQQQQRHQKLHQDPRCIHQLEGQRKLSEQEMTFVFKKLSAFNLSAKRRNQLINEVIFETRFGSLVKNNQTQQENSIKRAINIGCKLIRAGQWGTPSNISSVYQ